MREVWSGMRTITGFRSSNNGGVEGSVDRANELNLFFNRFDTASSDLPLPDSSAAWPQQPTPLHAPPPPDSLPPSCDSPLHTSSPPPPVTSTVNLTADQVRRQLQRLHMNKAAGPDGVPPRVLKACATQLCGVLQHVFNMSLCLQRVPVMWKTSCIVPVPKTPLPSDIKDYRPVALTSHIMKTMERLVLEQLRPTVQPLLDPLQFAYQPRLGVEDAIIYLLNRVYAHLDKPASTVRVMFFDFSSAFNTIQPALLGDKLNVMQVEAPLVSWIVDYLTGRPQYVRLQHCVSDRVVSNTGAPQGTVLSPFLFTLYTTDFNYCTETCHLQKFSDDSAVVGCISRGDEDEYRATVNDFVAWCELNHLQLNVTKTKELVVDLRRDKTQVTPISIKGVSVDTVEDYKYLGVHIDNKLDWAKNTDALYRKGQSRLYFLRRLRSFNICRTMLRIFYESVVASAILYAVACWGSRLRVADANRLNKLIRKASDVVGVELDSLMAVSERRTLAKLQTIMDNGSHPLFHTVMSHRSTFSARLIQPKCTTERHRSVPSPNSLACPKRVLKQPKQFIFVYRDYLAERRIRQSRLVTKNGHCNIEYDNVRYRNIFAYMEDTWSTFVETSWSSFMFFYVASFIFSWFIFTLIWYWIARDNGDLWWQNPSENHTACVLNMNDLVTSYLYSVETELTIGFGYRVITPTCPSAITAIMAQVLVGAVISCFWCGVLVNKIALPKKRAKAVTFSKNAVISATRNALCLQIRVANLRKSLLVGSQIYGKLIRTSVTPEGKTIIMEQVDVDFMVDAGKDNLFFVCPLTLYHVIDGSSPFFQMAVDVLPRQEFELVVFLDGTAESTNSSCQVRTSYIPQEIMWGYKFLPIISRNKKGRYHVDFSNFSRTEPVPTAHCAYCFHDVNCHQHDSADGYDNKGFEVIEMDQSRSTKM
ncbi:hypothetical protein NFI96_004933 [Prochilodus magdalenae]|nr:hypothetical protein NFI96_004933 [Prochilodus magdalenae]